MDLHTMTLGVDWSCTWRHRKRLRR